MTKGMKDSCQTMMKRFWVLDENDAVIARKCLGGNSDLEGEKAKARPEVQKTKKSSVRLALKMILSNKIRTVGNVRTCGTIARD